MHTKRKSPFTQKKPKKPAGPPRVAPRTLARQEKERKEKQVKTIINQVIASVLLLVFATAVKQMDHPLAQVMRENVSKSINASANAQDIAVFFGDLGYRYGALRDQVVSVFAPDAQDEAKEPAVEGEGAMMDEYDTGLSPFSDLVMQSPGIWPVLPAAGANSQPKTQLISTRDDMPRSEADQMVDFDSGEIRADGPYNISNTLLLPFSIVQPVEGRLTSDFGLRINPVTKKESFHYGVDIAAPKDTGIVAVYDGVVKEVGKSAAYGHYIVVDHLYESQTFYGHCSAVLAKEGQTVKQGEVIAKVGSTGWSTGNHLHFEVRREGYVLPPETFLSLQR